MGRTRKPKIEQTEIEYKGVNYALAFNLNVMEQIQEEYGTVEKWGNLVESEDEPNIKALKFGLMAMLNEGVDIWNEDHEGDPMKVSNRRYFTANQVGRILSEIGMQTAATALHKSVVESTKSEEKN